jgi:hypothetical protein
VDPIGLHPPIFELKKYEKNSLTLYRLTANATGMTSDG